jgi:hypothetical protein
VELTQVTAVTRTTLSALIEAAILYCILVFLFLEAKILVGF